MDKIPFTVYDIFGYIAPGALLTVALDRFFPSSKILATASQDAFSGIVSFFLLYVIGQIIAAPSSYLLERLFAKKCLQDPRRVLLEPKNTAGLRILFKEYFNPLPGKVRDKIIKKSGMKKNKMKDGRQKDEKYDTIYQYIYSKVKKDTDALGRLNIFLNLFGFSRNISFAAFLLSFILLVNSFITGKWENNYWIVGFYGVSIIMLYRFLKFYRHYTYELYLSYLTEKK